MTLKTNNAEGGSDGTTVTAGNSGGGSGDAFATVSAGSGTITYNAAVVSHGGLAYALAPQAGGGSANYMVMTDVASPTVNFSIRPYFYLTGYPSNETNWIVVQSTGSVNIAVINMTTTGLLKLRDAANATQFTFANPVPLNTWVRISLTGTADATAGQATLKLYNGDGSTPIETQSASGLNLTANPAGRVILGKLTSTTALSTYYIDDYAQNMASNVEIASVVPQSLWTFSKIAVFG